MHRRTALAKRATTATAALALVATSALSVAPAAFAGASPTSALPTTTTKTVAADPDKKFTSFAREMLTERKTADFWVVLAEEANLTSAKNIADWDERGQYVYDALTTTAKNSQASLVKELKAADVDYESYWISNRILVEDGTLELANELAASTKVEAIRETVKLDLVDPVKRTPVSDKAPQAVEWGLDFINAPEAWAQGYTGQGIVVSNIDTGVQFDHPALAQQYRGLQADGSVVNDYNWQDTTGSATEPYDENGHGTHTMGTMVGDDGAGNQIGVAPDAEWIATNGCDSCSDAALLESGQWIVAPTRTDGSAPDPSKRPNIVNNSWGYTAAGFIDDWYTETTAAWAAAGVFGAWASGNAGSGCQTTSSPGANTSSYSVGAFDSSGNIAAFSSRGAGEDGLVKPNIAAPGVNVRSSVPGDGYAAFNGTSMATPHLAGAVAVLWSAAPALVGDIEGTQALLNEAAVDTNDTTCGGTAENNNVWGEGKLDLAALIDAAPIGATGYVTGTVTSADGAPIASADVVIDGDRDRTVSTDADGTFSARVATGDYSVSASAFGYLPSTPASAAVSEDGTVDVPISLEAAPSHAVTGTVTYAGSGDPVVDAPVSLGSHFENVTTGADGTFAFADVPEGTYPISVTVGGCASSFEDEVVVDGAKDVPVEITPVTDDFGYSCATSTGDYLQGDTKLPLTGDDVQTSLDLPFTFPFYGEGYDSAFVTSNGHVNFLAGTTSYNNTTIPATSVPNAALFPFWDDLNLTADSGFYTGTTTVDGDDAFVLEWRNVHKYSPASDVLSFSVTLVEDGTVIYGYGPVTDTSSAKGDSASIGIENKTGTVGLQYAYNAPALSEGLQVTFTAPVLAFLGGTVTDRNTGEPIEGAEVTATSDDATRTATTGEDGTYSAIALPGTYTVDITAPDYESKSGTVSLAPEATGTFDASLAAGLLTVSTGAVSATLPLGGTTTKRFTVKNTGTAPAEVNLGASGGGFTVLGDKTATTTGVVKGVQGKATAAKLPFGSGASKAEGLRSSGAGVATNRKVAAASYPDLAADEVSLSHSTSHEIVASSSVACPSGVTKLLRTYTPADFGITGDFEPTSVTFGIQEVATPSTTATVTLYTLSGNFVYSNLTPIGSGQVTVTNDFGSWYEVPIDADATIAPDDILVVEVAGAAIYVGGNPSAETSPTYLASDGCGTPEPTTADSLGFPDSNLVIDVNGEVAGSGGGVAWLDVQPPSFTLAPGKSVAAITTLTADVDQPGAYTASINIGNNTPYDVAPVAATMNVKAPSGWGKITGTVTGSGAALEDAVVALDGISYDVVLRTGADGTYSYWMQKSNAPLTVTVAADGFVPATKKAQIVAGQTTVYNFALTAL